MANTEFQLQVMRMPNGFSVADQSYATPVTSIIFTDPIAGSKYYVSHNIGSMGGAFKGEEIEITLVRDGDSTVNTETRPATAILLHLAIPVTDVART